jgi:hypothetical protein
MTSARSEHTATLLSNGKVLLAGGVSSSGFLATAELYDPSTNAFTATVGVMASPRHRHTATLLNNGTVLLVGGENASSNLSSAELYDPATDTFTAIPGGMTVARSLPTATLLNDGKVLIAGGHNGISVNSGAELYDPSANSFTAIPGGMTSARWLHTATLLNNGKVLLAGGHDNGGSFLSSAELYDPSTDSFTAIPGGMTAARRSHSATRLENGEVLLTGGHNGIFINSSAERYDGSTNMFAATSGNMGSSRERHLAVLLSDGRALLVGGSSGSGPLTSAELYHPLEQNQRPVADAGADQVVACASPNGTTVMLDGSGSTDPDDDNLTYAWTGSFPEGGGAVAGVNPTVTLPLGGSTISLVVNDGTMDSEADTVTVEVVVGLQGLESPLGVLVPDGNAPPLPQHAFKAGRTLPLKLQISCGGFPLGDAAVAAPRIVGLVRNGDALDISTIDLDAGQSNDSGVLFRFEGGSWVYNLSTQGLATGTYTITIEMPDGQRYAAGFVLR